MTDAAMRAILRSAWPATSIDHLLRAVALPDSAQAAEAWRQFESAADFDALAWGEFRLVGLAAKHIAVLAPDSAMRPRIAGIERSLWSRSQLAIGEAGTALRALSTAGVPIMAIKGAGRTASGDPAARGRVVNDIDLVVRGADIGRAYDLLVEDGWTPAGSGSPLFQRTRLGMVVGTNLVRGRFGNIDLHRTAFHSPFDDRAEDDAIWDRAATGRLGYVEVRIPSPTDTVLIALAHGALDAHKSSDWLMDIASAIDAGVDWDLLVDIALRRRLQAAAAIALSYVDERLQRQVPLPVLRQLQSAAARHPFASLAIIAETRPKERRSAFFWVARALAKQKRLLRRERKSVSPLVWASLRPARAASPSDLTCEHRFALPGRTPGAPWRGRVDVTLAVEVPGAWRRIDFEVNAGSCHLLRLRALVRGGTRRLAPLRFRFDLSLDGGDPDPVLVAVPSRSFNTDAPVEEVARYAAARFSLGELRAVPSG